MITFLGRAVGWVFMTVILLIASILLCSAIGLSWIWEHTIGKLWQRKR